MVWFYVLLVGLLAAQSPPRPSRMRVPVPAPAPRNQLTVYSLAAVAPQGQEQNARVVLPLDDLIAPAPLAPGSLRALGAERGLLVGSEAQPLDLISEREYRETLAREYAVVTPSFPALYFGAVHPQRNRYAFCIADAMLRFARANGMQMRGHTLVWHDVLPEWLTQGTFLSDERTAILREHIQTVVGRYRGSIAAWDVVNEAVEDSGRLRNTIWLQGIGPQYLDLAFRWAREADPVAKLFYNDFGADGLGTKSDGVYALVRGLKERGAPIDGVGFQAHLRTTFAPEERDVAANMARLAQLGLEVHITEMDVALRLPATAADLTLQAELYRRMLRACLAAPNCKSFISWGFTDRHSWIPRFFARLWRGVAV